MTLAKTSRGIPLPTPTPMPTPISAGEGSLDEGGSPELEAGALGEMLEADELEETFELGAFEDVVKVCCVGVASAACETVVDKDSVRLDVTTLDGVVAVPVVVVIATGGPKKVAVSRLVAVRKAESTVLEGDELLLGR